MSDQAHERENPRVVLFSLPTSVAPNEWCAFLVMEDTAAVVRREETIEGLGN